MLFCSSFYFWTENPCGTHYIGFWSENSWGTQHNFFWIINLIGPGPGPTLQKYVLLTTLFLVVVKNTTGQEKWDQLSLKTFQLHTALSCKLGHIHEKTARKQTPKTFLIHKKQKKPEPFVGHSLL